MNAESRVEDEVEVWWGGYSYRALAPTLALTLVLGVGLILGLFLLVQVGLQPTAARGTGYGLIGGLWLVQLLRCGYRLVGYSYRLTTRRLFLQRGFSHMPPGVELTAITAVRVERTPVERWLGVGRVVVETRNGAAPLVLEGVYQPNRTAETIRGKK